MNILHLKYAVEIAKAGSINKASETLLIAQPNLSRSVKELEADLGITIFDRSARGMFLTPEGEEFIGYAKKIIQQIDQVEALYKNGYAARQKFSLTAPRSGYIAEAFTAFSSSVREGAAELFYQEANNLQTISSVLKSDYDLGIVRYQAVHDNHFKQLFAEKGLNCEFITDFTFLLTMRQDHPLASAETIRLSDLTHCTEIVHGDAFIPSLITSEVKKEAQPSSAERKICLFERSAQYELLAGNRDTFLWTSPEPKTLLNRYGLIQRECADCRKLYKDVLISRREYHLTELDKRFITELCSVKRRVI